MDAKTVFEVYKALDFDEKDKLYDLVKADFNNRYNSRYGLNKGKSKKEHALDFSDADALSYVLDLFGILKINN
ncbi:hypothetical protein [Aestuariibaculum sediminum]|uniref:Uncharacterized protein n=1 Tax=Aestuariibaculum sediminum TaxID=2770637 RepID=A0A8J6Q879_9FLAO|nr:hypothetical protein [Aestuariibaculum sediminum]MBD0831297.1 hypothetical protein [Aestuariibaculum sediminum]